MAVTGRMAQKYRGSSPSRIKEAQDRTKEAIKARAYYECSQLNKDEIEFLKEVGLYPIAPIVTTKVMTKDEIKRHYPDFSMNRTPIRNRSWRNYDK
jgi:hypothetical protein